MRLLGKHPTGLVAAQDNAFELRGLHIGHPMILAAITMKSDTDLKMDSGRLNGAAKFRTHRTNSQL
jgi:hypothetical protein